MNLSVNRVGQLAMLAVALFFFACEDEASLLGYKNPNNKFKVSYVEIPLGSSLLLTDSLETSNIHYAQTTDFARIMVGRYMDPLFGELKAEAYAQFRPTTTTTLKSTAVLDSASMQLRFDYYAYGGSEISNETFSVHEITESMVVGNGKNYHNFSTLPYNPTPIGSNSYRVSYNLFKEEYAKSSIDTAVVRFTLSPDFGGRLLDVAKNNPDSALHKPDVFYNLFKGLAIVPANNAKIVGFSLPTSFSRITLYYHDAETDSLELNFVFSSSGGYFTGNFTRITADRSATADLSGLISPATEFTPPSDKRYIQAGAGIMAKVDISKFYEFAKADSNQNIIINSAELAIENVESYGTFEPPYSLAWLMLQDDNRLKYFASEQDTTDFTSFRGFLSLYDTYGVGAVSDNASSFGTLTYSKDRNRYSSLFTLFFQQLYIRRNDERVFNHFALYPHASRVALDTSPRYEAGKSVNRVSFNKDNIKLKIFYTRPTIKSNQ